MPFEFNPFSGLLDKTTNFDEDALYLRLDGTNSPITGDVQYDEGVFIAESADEAGTGFWNDFNTSGSFQLRQTTTPKIYFYATGTKVGRVYALGGFATVADQLIRLNGVNSTDAISYNSTDTSIDFDISGTTEFKVTADDVRFDTWKFATQQQIISTSATNTTLLIKNNSALQNIQHHVEIEGSLTMTQATGLVTPPDLDLIFKRSGGAGNKRLRWDETNNVFDFDAHLRLNTSSLLIDTGQGILSSSDLDVGIRFTATNSGQIEMTDSDGDIRFNVMMAAGDDQGFIGLNTATPLSRLDITGSLGGDIVGKTANYTATSDDYTIICNATSGDITITLPTASTSTRRTYHIKKIDSSVNTVTIDGDSAETIDDAATQTLNNQYDSITIQSDGTEWWII